MPRRYDIKGMKALEKLLKELGMVPQKIVGKAARAGAKIPLKDARKNAPVELGDLKKGIVIRAERRIKLGKKVFDVMMDPAKNPMFVKISKEGKRAYYPSSQEYGFMTVNGKFIPGFHYFRDSMVKNKRDIEEEVVSVMGKEVDKVLRGG